MKDYYLLLDKYITLEDYSKDYVEFEIKVTKEMVDSKNFIDEGLLVSLLDSYSSISAVLLKNDLENHSANLSINQKLFSLDNMKLNEKYKMRVLLNFHNNNFLLLEIRLLDKENVLIKQGFHLMKILNPKF